jgi:hypothetical protein
VLVALALAGCGGHAPTLADCLNAKGFLVEERSGVVRGSSPAGVNFTVTVYAHPGAARRAFRALPRGSGALLGDAVVDFAGNPPSSPGHGPARLSRGAVAAISHCLAHP